MKLIMASLICASVLFAWKAVAVTHSVGVARSADSRDVRYIEHHQYLENGKHLVRYFGEESSLLAEKELDYPDLPQHPILKQANYLDDTRTIVSRDGNIATITVTKDKSIQTHSFPLSSDIVIDAGFDSYIRNNWDSFLRRPNQELRFAVVGQKRLLKLKIKFLGISNEKARFTIKPNNWLIRMLLPDIQLTYDVDRQLVRYEGFSNLKPKDQPDRRVVITYNHYKSDVSLDQPLQEWLP